MLSIDLDIGNVVLENGGHIDLLALSASMRSSVGAGADRKALGGANSRLGLLGGDGGRGSADLREGALREDAGGRQQLAAGQEAGASWGAARRATGRHSHEQAGLSTRTVTDDDELATNLSHLCELLLGLEDRVLVDGAGGWRAVMYVGGGSG